MPYPQERHTKTIEMTEILDKDFNVVGKIMDSGKVESESRRCYLISKRKANL